MSAASAKSPPITLQEFLFNNVSKIVDENNNIELGRLPMCKAAAMKLPAVMASICLRLREMHPDGKFTLKLASGDDKDLSFLEYGVGTPEFDIVKRYSNMPFFQLSNSSYARNPEAFHTLISQFAASSQKPSDGFNSFRNRDVSQWLSDTFLGWHCAHEDEDGCAHTAVALAPKSQPLTGEVVTKHIQLVGGIKLIDNAPKAAQSLYEAMLKPPFNPLMEDLIAMKTEISDKAKRLYRSKHTAEAKVQFKAFDRVEDASGGAPKPSKPKTVFHVSSTRPVTGTAIDADLQEMEELLHKLQTAEPPLETHAFQLFLTLLFNGGKGTLVRGERPVVLVNPVVVSVHGTYLTSMATECAVRGWVAPSATYMIVEQIVMRELMAEYTGSLSLYKEVKDPRLKKHQRQLPHKNALWWRLRAEGDAPRPPRSAKDILVVERIQQLPKDLFKFEHPETESTSMRMTTEADVGVDAAAEPETVVNAEQIMEFCQTRVKLAANTAAAFNAAAVIMVSQSDGGSKFRDREGRAAVQSALSKAVRAMLYDV